MFNGSKEAPTLEQFVAPRQRQLRVWPLGPVHEHESVPLPMQARHSRGFLLVDDFTSIRHALERVLERLAVEGERRLTANHRLAVLDAQHSAPDSICAAPSVLACGFSTYSPEKSGFTSAAKMGLRQRKGA